MAKLVELVGLKGLKHLANEIPHLLQEAKQLTFAEESLEAVIFMKNNVEYRTGYTRNHIQGVSDPPDSYEVHSWAPWSGHLNNRPNGSQYFTKAYNNTRQTFQTTYMRNFERTITPAVRRHSNT